MIDDEFRAFVMKALEKEIVRNTPAAKARRAFQAGNQAMKREHKAIRRSLAAKHAAKSRDIRKRQVEAELALRKREVEREAEMDARRWNLIIGSR